MRHYYSSLLLLLFTLLNGTLASYVTHPNINFDPLEQLTISGTYNGISLYKDTKQLTSLPPLTSSVISLSNDTLQLLGSSSIDGSIYDACIFKNTLIFGGNFTTMGDQSVKNIASIDLTTHQLKPLSKGLDGIVHSIYCDTDQVYVGGSFTAPSTSDSVSYSTSLSQFGGNVALWKGEKWVGLPWKGLNGPVYSILKNKNQIVFGGRFDTTTDGQSLHAPASQPISLPATGVSATSGLNPSSILCSSSSWLLDEGVQGTWQTAFSTYSVNPSLVRIANSKVENRQTKEFSIRSLANTTQLFSLSYLDPITGIAVTCSDNCTLSNNPSVTYQDFRILDTFMTTGIAIDIKSWYGVGGGLSFVQVFQSEIFTYAVNPDPTNICTSNVTLPKVSTVGNWTTVTSGSPYLSYPIKSTLDTSSITFYPNIAESGIYEVLVYTPPCKSTACSERTDIDLTFALSKANKENATMSQKYPGSRSIFTGYFDLSDNYNPSIVLSLAKNASITTSSEIVALSVQLVKMATNDALSSVLVYNSTQTNITMTSLAWGALPDNVPYNSIVQAMEVTLDGDLYLAGEFTGKDGLGSQYTNIAQYDASAKKILALPGGGLNGAIHAIAVTPTDLYIGGSFNSMINSTATSSNSLTNVAQYNIQKPAWSSLKSGVNGPVKSLSVSKNSLLISGDFTQLVKSVADTYPIRASGNAWWDTKKAQWISDSSVPYLSGTVYKTLTVDDTDYFVGNVKSAQRYQSDGITFFTSKDTLQSIPFYPGDSQSSISSGVLFSSSSMVAENTSSTTIFGGEFVLPNNIQNIAIYNNLNNTWSGFEGANWQGQISTMAVHENLLYVGGRFTSAAGNNLAVFSISNRSLSLFPKVQTNDGSPANVNIIRHIPAEKAMIVGGNFNSIDSLACTSICSLNTVNFQWNTLGSGLVGEVHDFLLINEKLVTSGNMTLNNSPLTIAEFDFKKNTWGPFDTANLPGPSRAISYDNMTNHLYISGQTADNSSTYLRIWDGQQFKAPVVELGSGSHISKLTMLPIADSKTNILLATGLINLGELGNVSAAFYDGKTWIPYLVTSNDNGESALSSMFFLDQPYVPAIIKKYLPTPIVILVSIAVALGIVFLIVFCAMCIIFMKRKRDHKVNPQSSPSGYYGKPPRTPQSLLTMLKETSDNEDKQHIDTDDHGHYSMDKPRHLEPGTEQFYNMSKSISTEHLHEQALTPFNTAIAMTTARAPPPLPTAHARSVSNHNNFHPAYPATAAAALAAASPRPESYARPISEYQRDTDSFYNNGYTNGEMVEVPGRQSPYNPFRNSEGFTNNQPSPMSQSVAASAFATANSRHLPSSPTANNYPSGESASYNNMATAGMAGAAVLGGGAAAAAAAAAAGALSHHQRNEANQSQGSRSIAYNNTPPPPPPHLRASPQTGKGSPMSLVGASDESSLVDPISGPQATRAHHAATGNVKWTTANSKEALATAVITPTIAVHESENHLPQENYHDAQSSLSVNAMDTTGSNVRWTNVNNPALGVATVEPAGSRESVYHDSFYSPLQLGSSTNSNNLLNPITDTTSEGLSSDPDIARWTTAPAPEMGTVKVEAVPSERPNSGFGRSQYQPSLTSLNAFPHDTQAHLSDHDYLSHAPKTHIDAEIEEAADDMNTRVMHKNAFRLSEAGSLLAPIDTTVFPTHSAQDELLSPDSAVRWKSANVGSPIETAHAANILAPATAMVTRRSAKEDEDAFEEYYNPKPQEEEESNKPKKYHTQEAEPVGRKSESIDDVIANRDLNALSMLIQDEEEDQINPLYKMPVPTITRKESTAAGPGAMDGRASSKRMVEEYMSSRNTKKAEEPKDKKTKYKSDFKSIMAIAIQNNTKYPIATEENPHLYYAKFEFSAREHGELGFGNADPIIVVDSSDDIWWMGYKADKSDGSFIQGVFPSNYVEIATELR